MLRLVLGPPAPLRGSHAPLASERPRLRGDEEEAAGLDEHGDGHRLVAVPLEGLQLVEHERPVERLQAVGVEPGGMAGQPEEAVLDGPAGDTQDAGGLAQRDAGEHQAEKRRVQVRLLLVAVGPEGLP